MKKILVILLILIILTGCNKENKEQKTINAVSGRADTLKIVKKELQESSKFTKYLEKDERIIYLANNVEEIYYMDANKQISLKDYMRTVWQSTDDSIKQLTRYMDLKSELNNGETKIYKSLEFDITLVKCNKSIYIGDYSLEYDDNSMCL